MTHVEQLYFNRLRHLRLSDRVKTNRFGPDHAPTYNVSFTAFSLDGACIGRTIGVARKIKDAKRDAMHRMLLVFRDVPDPCSKTMTWNALAETLFLPLEGEGGKIKVMSFREPPHDWFYKPQRLGVDWEGSPTPCIVQIAVEGRGVAIDVVDATWVRCVLADTRHTHGVFGEHELGLVARGINLQPNYHTSLAECTSLAFMPHCRLVKDETIHHRTNWVQCARERTLPREALIYAALDAFATLRLLSS